MIFARSCDRRKAYDLSGDDEAGRPSGSAERLRISCRALRFVRPVLNGAGRRYDPGIQMSKVRRPVLFGHLWPDSARPGQGSYPVRIGDERPVCQRLRRDPRAEAVRVERPVLR